VATLRKIFGISLVLSAAACAADTSLLDLVMPDAHVLVGANVEHILSSQIGKDIGSQIQNKVPDLQQILLKAGFDPTHDLQEILIAATGKGQNGPVLFLVRGSFDAAKVSAAAASTGRTPQIYEGVPIMDNPSQSNGAFAFLNGSIAVGGDLDQVKAAIRRRNHPAVLSSELASRVASLSDRYDIWALSTAPLSEMTSGASNPQMKQATDLARSIQQVSGGIKLTADLELAAELMTHNEKEATQLRDTLQFFSGLALASKQNRSGLDPQALKLTADAKTVRISVLVTAEQLKKAYEGQMARLEHGATPVAVVRKPPAQDMGLTIQTSERDMGIVIVSPTKQ
jgi:hypothetical protein